MGARGLSDAPAPPAGFTLDDAPSQARQKASRAQSVPPPPGGFTLDAPQQATTAAVVLPPAISPNDVVDGDTLRTTNGPDLRLWGVDAPELHQSGYRRDYSTVPIGAQSRNALSDFVSEGLPVAGSPVGTSYDRTVAPFTVNGEDAGLYMARSGNAFVEPDFLKSDPEREFEYMQAQRLARENRLGVHGVYVERPSDYRHNALDYVVPRETIAQFWDTPTPWGGMGADAEHEFLRMANDPSVSVDAVVKYARDNGGIVNPDDVVSAREKAAKEKTQIGFDYVEPPKILTDLGDGATGAAIRGYGSGFLAGGLDEAGAVADSLGLTPGRENVWNSDRRLADIWENNEEQNAAILGYDRFAHPYATTGGDLAGGLTSAVMVPVGAGARTAPGLFRVGMGYGALNGFLGTDGSVLQRLENAAIEAPIGGAVGAVGGKLIEAGAPFVAAGARKLFGKGVDDAAGAAGQAFDDIPPPPEGFTMDQPTGGVTDAGAAPSAAPDTAAPPRATRLDQSPTEAQLRASADNLEPRDVLPIPSNEVGSVEEAAAADAGRYAPAKPVDERSELKRQTVHNWRGEDVPKVGPVDLVGFVRTRGGVQDQGGELTHMGMTNAARSGMDFVGQETRFGPLVNNADGMTLDEAADAAWRAGYFPDHAERPTTGEFLDALRGTYEGTDRHFLPEDFAQIDRHAAARTQRLDLEQQQLRDGQVYQDRSVPAGEPAPLPPASAYEEWGSTPPDFAGNVNLGKLDTPQDISRALSQTERRVGFDAATRGRVTQAETEQLASDLGMTADDLLARRKGQAFNAEQALAARQILAKSGNELVNAARKITSLENPGDELLAEFRQKWLRHVAIQEQVAGATAEAGRALAQFRMLADSRAVRGDVLSAIVKRGGGKDELQEAAGALLDAAETGSGKFNVVADQLTKPTWRHKAMEYYINALLSGPQTHVVNMVGNTITSMAQIPEFATAAAIGAARRAVSGRTIDRITGSEVGARAFGLIQGTKDGLKLFARALRSGEASDFASKVEGEQYKAIGGLKGEVIRMPTRLLTAEDELFKGIARRMELNAQAMRIAAKEGVRGAARARRIAELVANPTDNMLAHAMDYGRYLTFQRPLGPFAQKVSGLTNDSLVAKVFLPFVRTPTNLLKFAAERSPAAPLLKEWRADFAAGGARRDLAVARAALGSGVALVVYNLAKQGVITGSQPSDPKQARMLEADHWQPYSIKIGGKWYSYKRLDPISTTLGVAADMATLPQGMSEKQQQDKATLVVASIMGNLADKTWLSGVSDVVSALDEPDRHADDLIQRLVASFVVPAGVAQVARTIDPTSRKVETVGDAIKARIPGLSDNLLPRRDVWGRPVVSEGGVGPDLLSPVWVRTQLDDPVNAELLRLNYSPGYPSQKVGGRELSADEYDQYHALSGGLAHDRLASLVTSPQWRQVDDDQKTKLARKTVDDARDDARKQMFGASPPPPPGFTLEAPEGEAGGVNVFQDLQRQIPGIEITSGYRTPAYQADMRRRGYAPANNSAHLTGSALDIVPPPGKSVAWLAAQVGRLHPEAKMLNEGDHLHATFPGYFGAPAIGEAAAAGLHNPNAGMPAPPPGFRLEQ